MLYLPQCTRRRDGPDRAVFAEVPDLSPEAPELAQGDRCTECHMPDQQASNLPVYHEGEELFLSMANHRIGIFKDP
ncbi:MAG: hypothetical protein OXE49_07055 [Gemmatimonadetes bacterium]|nr:hypothetical protein [Gemmatimonadota bacterium]